jgi:hypothetical protein
LKNLIKNISGLYLVLKKDNYHFHLSKTRLLNKIKNFPSWMNMQIENEFKNLKNKKSNIEKTIDNLKKCNLLKSAELVRFQITNNKIKYQNFLSAKYHPRFIRFHFFLKKCMKFITFPDVDFLYSIHDSLEDLKILECLESFVFCISKLKKNDKIVLFPHVEWMQKNETLLDIICKAALQLEWDEKINKAFWRGTTTGSLDLNENERFKIVKMAKQYPDYFDAYFSNISLTYQNKIKLLKKYFLKKKYLPHLQVKYKYLLAIDGNAFAGSFFWQLFSNSLIIKNKSQFLEWYYVGLKSNEHYIEYENEKDLIEKIIMLKENDSLAKKTSKQASEFAREFLSNENIVAYIFKLFQKIDSIS